MSGDRNNRLVELIGFLLVIIAAAWAVLMLWDPGVGW